MKSRQAHQHALTSPRLASPRLTSPRLAPPPSPRLASPRLSPLSQDVFLAANAAFRMSGVRVRGQPPPKMTLSEAAREPRTFVRLTDSILDAIDIAPCEEGQSLDAAWDLLDRLKRRDFYKQVGKEVNIETLPACSSCGKGTAVTAKFCEKCGKSTVTRKGHMIPGKSKWYQSDGMMVTEENASRDLLALVPDWIRKEIIEANALMVKVSAACLLPRLSPLPLALQLCVGLASHLTIRQLFF